MDASLSQQMRRELLDVLRANAGQASWQRLPVTEYEVLQQMEREGIVERVQEPGRLTVAFTYRVKPMQAGQEERQ